MFRGLGFGVQGLKTRLKGSRSQGFEFNAEVESVQAVRDSVSEAQGFRDS